MDGHEVALASTAAEALTLLSEDPFDVVVSDIVLPRKTGIALLGDIRKLQPDLPVIMITGEPEVGTAAKAVRKGAFDYLSKPVSRENITRTVAAAIEKKALLDKNRKLEEENRAYRAQLEERVKEKTQEVWAERDKLSSAFTAMKDGIYIVDPEHNIEFANAALASQFGPFEGRKCYVYLHDRDDVCPWCHNEQVWAGETVQWEWTSPRNGKTYERFDAPSENADGSTSKLSIFHDITERKQAQESELEHYKNIGLLSEAAIRFVSFPADEDIYAYIAETVRKLTGEVIVIVNSINEAGDVLTNRALLGLGKFATQVARLIGRNPKGMTIVPQDDELLYLSDRKLHDSNKSLYVISQKSVPKPICAALEKLYNIGKIYTIGLARENHLLGTIVIILSTGQTLQASEFIEALVNLASITLQRREAEDSLLASKTRFKNFFENQPALCYMASPEAIILDINTTALNVLGYEKSELIGQPASMLYSAESAQRYPDLLAEWKQQGHVRNEEMTLVSKTGQEHIIVLSSDTVRDSEGHILNSLSVLLDITERKEAEQRQRRLLDNIIESVSMMTQVRDPYTAGHQKRVAELTSALAEQLQLDKVKTAGLRAASLLHDIGKLAVPSEILSKPSTLTKIEYEIVKAHVNVGTDILREIDFPWPIADIVLQHHERLDGSGYPQGLIGEDNILLEARIIAVADVVEAMSSHRPYRPSLGIAAALEEIDNGSGTRFDAAVVAACHHVLKNGFQFKAV